MLLTSTCAQAGAERRDLWTIGDCCIRRWRTGPGMGWEAAPCAPCDVWWPARCRCFLHHPSVRDKVDGGGGWGRGGGWRGQARPLSAWSQECSHPAAALRESGSRGHPAPAGACGALVSGHSGCCCCWEASATRNRSSVASRPPARPPNRPPDRPPARPTAHPALSAAPCLSSALFF